MQKSPIKERLAAGRQQLAKQESEALLVYSPENRRYLSGFTAGDPEGGALLITAAKAFLLTDFRYQIWAEQEAPDFEVLVYRESLGKTLAELLRDLGVRKLGFEPGYVTYQQYQRFTVAVEEAGLQVEWQPLTNLVEGLREIKTQSELAAIRRALELSEKVLAQIAGKLSPGLTESQVAWQIEKSLREGGAGGLAFPPIVAGGLNSAQPHHQPGDYRLEAGEPIIIDMGARVDGYCADITRTYVIGPPDEHFRKIYGVVRRAQARAEKELRAGMDSQAADALARDSIKEAGYGEAFGHSLGHGVGLAVHEAPALSPLKERQCILQAGSVVTVEPGIYLAGWGGVRLEDMAVINAEGAEVLNQLGFYEW
jgi:Xaa-Pro aminopeptidase